MKLQSGSEVFGPWLMEPHKVGPPFEGDIGPEECLGEQPSNEL